MKRRHFTALFCLVAALVLAVGCFSGCTGNVKTAEGVFNVRDYGVKGNGSTDDAGAILDLIDTVSQSGGTIFFPAGTYFIKEDSVSIPYRVGMIMQEGASFKLGEDGTLKINSCAFSAPKAQLFFGEGTVSGFGSVPNVLPEWYGAVADDGKDDSEAIGKAIRYAGKVTFGEGTYNIDKTISLKGGFMGSGMNLIGCGADKSKLVLGPDVIGFDGHSDGASVTVFEANGIGFYEKDNGKTSFAIKTNSGAVKARNCHFEGLDTGVWFDYGGFANFENNTAKDTRVVFEISERSMFLYFLGCKADHCGTLIKAVVSPSGGVSNGILVRDCESTNAYAEDIYITENQAVWIYNSSFTGGTGGVAAVYFENHIDSGIDHCVISSAPGTARAGIFWQGVHYASITDNTISDCENGIYLRSSDSMPITDNKFSGNSVSDLCFRTANKLFISRNEFNSPVTKPITAERKSGSISVVGNSFKAAEYDIATVLDGSNYVIKDNVFGK